MDWVKSLGGKTIYIERIDVNGNAIQPPNKEESDNDPFLRKNADITISWPTTDIHSLWPFVEKVTKQLGLE